MAVVVRDLVPAFLEFWAKAVQEPQRRLELWDEYVAANPDVLNDAARNGSTVDPKQVLAGYGGREDLIRANAPRATEWITTAFDLVAPALAAADVELPAVAMVGLGTSNGWVSEVDGRCTLFLAVEQIADLDGARILAAHELAHALQLPLPERPWPEDGTLGETVYAEGFATALTRELLPQYGLAEHLWFGTGYENWLTEAERALPEATAGILAELESAEHDVLRRYLQFIKDGDLPTRIGYLVGTRAVQRLRETYTWPELARWSTTRATDELRAVLDQNSDQGATRDG